MASRPSRDLLVAAHQQLTHDWWEFNRNEYELFVSDVVIDEIGRGDRVGVVDRLNLVSGISELSGSAESRLLVKHILKSNALPPKAATDAAHIAIAAANGIELLLTWNCKHIANPHILRTINTVCFVNNLEAPLVYTPLELMGGYSND